MRRNRKLRGPLRARLPSPKEVLDGAARLARTALPTLVSLLVVAGFCIGCYAGYRWLTESDRFALSKLDIRGTAQLTDEQIRTRLGVEIGDNIFSLRLSQLERRLEADPWIASAELQRQLPDRLIVEIHEHHAAVLVSLGGMYLANERGVVFKRAATALGEGEGLPIITGLSRTDYTDDPDAAAARIRDALAIASDYAKSAERPAIGEIHLDARRGTTLVTYDTATAIRVGHARARALAERLRYFDAAWASLTPNERDAARIVYVDNTNRPERVTVGYVETRTN